MAVWDDGGWLHLGYGDATNGVIIKCKKVSFDESDKSIFIDYPSDGHTGVNFRTMKRTIKVEGIFFDSNTDYDTFKEKLTALQTAGVFNIRVERDTTPTYRTWNGTNITMPVLYESIKGEDKPYGGNSEVWLIKQITFRQAGALADVNA